MFLLETIGTWRLEPSGDGKLHYLHSPDSCLQIQVNTDDYQDDTKKEIMMLLALLARHWPKKPKWEKITKKTIGDLFPIYEEDDLHGLDKEWSYWATADEVYSEDLWKCPQKPEKATHILYISK